MGPNRLVQEPTATTEPTEEALAEAGDYLQAATDYWDQGQLGLAIEAATQALGVVPSYEPAVRLLSQVRPEATRVQATAVAEASAAATAEAQAQATAEARAIIVLDIPGLMGKSAPEVRGILGGPRRIEPVRAGVLENLPGGGEAWYYSTDHFVGDLLFDRGQRLAAFLISLSPAPRGYDDALRKLGLPTGQRPSTTALAVQRWNNLAGYYVQLTQDLRDRTIINIVIGPPRT